MTNREGTPIWYELLTTAPDAAQDFYAAVTGWKFQTPPGGLERGYRLFSDADGEGIGGVMQMPEGAPFDPIWAVYFGVEDVDASVQKVKSLGGSVHIEPQDIPGVGRFAFVADPQGATFYLMRGASDEASTAFAMEKLGHCAWNELVTSHQEAALEFYSALFGWEKSGAMPMGEMGDYTFLKCGDIDLGAMMTRQEDTKRPFWNFAFSIADIDAANTAVQAGGGTVYQGPHELPTEGDWLIQTRDPQGATAMFVGPRLQEKK